jgi:uncharacterized protein (DUF2252 family)
MPMKSGSNGKRGKSAGLAGFSSRVAVPTVPVQSASIPERDAAGRSLRAKYPLSEQGLWRSSFRQHDPIDLLIENSRGRIEALVPIRYGRMLASPFTFLRGSAAVMAGDLSTTLATGLHVQACGDCHLVNFGGFATPERRLIFDINDFDETSLAPWEWDVKRLVASFVVAGRDRQFAKAEAQECAWRAARSYRKSMVRFAKIPILEAWYDRMDVDDLIKDTKPSAITKSVRKQLDKAAIASAHHREFAKLAQQIEPEPRIEDQPPLIYHFGPTEQQVFWTDIEDSLRRYKESLAPELQTLLDRFKLVDVAVKVVGVGSVGTFCGIGLLLSGAGDPLFLQFKEARQSVLEPYAGTSRYAHHGERVVRGQRLMQSASDMFLGWMTGTGKSRRNFYVRQLKDAKIKPPVEVALPRGLQVYARYCGEALARAHVRSGDPVMLAAYMGNDDAFEDTMADFAVAYADQTDRDFEALVAAVRSGRLIAETGR